MIGIVVIADGASTTVLLRVAEDQVLLKLVVSEKCMVGPWKLTRVLCPGTPREDLEQCQKA